MGNLERMTEKQRRDWPEAVQEINRYTVGASGNPDHSDWTFDWREESRPGRGQSFSAVFNDGEHFAQVIMDVYGMPSVSVATLDWLHSSSDEECMCSFCEKARWEEYTPEERAQIEASSKKVADHIAKTRRGIIEAASVDAYVPASVVVDDRELEDEMFNHRPEPIQPNYAVAPGEWLAEWLEENRVSSIVMAEYIGCEHRWLQKLIKGKVPMDGITAGVLEVLTKIPAKSWMAFQEQYEKDVARLPWWKRWARRGGMSR